MMKFSQLNEIHRGKRDTMHQDWSLRVHRSLSWLNCAEQNEHADSRFIFLWISFNAAYAQEIPKGWEISQKRVFTNFMQKLLASDKDKLLFNLVWQEFSGSIRVLINNKFVYQKFWDYKNDLISKDEWTNSFNNSIKKANRALGDSDTGKVLSIVFERLYALRNQLIHGGATWCGSINRDQIRDGVKIMEQVVPIIISIMLLNDLGPPEKPCYPVVS